MEVTAKDRAAYNTEGAVQRLYQRRLSIFFWLGKYLYDALGHSGPAYAHHTPVRLEYHENLAVLKEDKEVAL
jgi:hypothetical protein